MNNHEERLAALEEWQEQVNHNIQSLYELINTTDYITSVSPLMESGQEVGYTISFLHSEPITIYHGEKGEKGDKGDQGDKGDKGDQGIPGQDGEDGADGYTPQVGLTQQADGNWYWTLDGQLMTDSQGNPIRANGLDGQDGEDGEDGQDGQDGEDGQDGSSGVDGKDAPTPQIKLGSTITGGTVITDNGGMQAEAWYLSVDGGQTWYRISGDKGEQGDRGPQGSTGPQGPQGPQGEQGETGDAWFAAAPTLSGDGTHYIFTLTGGSTFSIPAYRTLQIGEGTGTLTLSNVTTDISITLPTGSSVGDFSALMAQVVPEGDDVSIATRVDNSGWKVEATLAESGSKVTVTAPQDGSKAMLRVTLVDNVGGEIVASCVLQAPLRSAAVGDYYYSDGTYSPTLDAQKECIGVVFYVGNVAKDDTWLQQKIGDTSTGSHGLVVALKNADGDADNPAKWGGDTDKLIGQQEGYANVSYRYIPQTLIGYGCTEALRHYNETADEDKKCIAVSAVDTYAATNTAPDGTSGWYLPSLKELALLISGDFELQNQVNKGTDLAAERDKQLEAAKGDKLIGAWYWASAEKDGSSGSPAQIAQWVWCYHCEATNSGRPISDPKYLEDTWSPSPTDYSKNPLRTRAILAF